MHKHVVPSQIISPKKKVFTLQFATLRVLSCIEIPFKVFHVNPHTRINHVNFPVLLETVNNAVNTFSETIQNDEEVFFRFPRHFCFEGLLQKSNVSQMLGSKIKKQINRH